MVQPLLKYYSISFPKKKNYIRSSSDTDIRLTFKDQPRHSIVVVRVGEIVNEVSVHAYVGDGFSSICNL